MILSNYWNSAWRSLTKKKGFSAINIVGLAIGMAAALLILTYVAFEYSYDDIHIIGKTKSTNFQNEKYKKGMSFKYYINGA